MGEGGIDMYRGLGSWESSGFFLKSFTTTNSPAPPHFPLPSVKTSSPAATEQGGVRDLSGNLCVAFSPRERRGGCHAGEEGADRRDVSNRALLSSAVFLFLSLLLYSFAIALENVGREEIGEILLQRPWAWGFLMEKYYK